MLKQDIINSIEKRMGKTKYSQWYVGITMHPEERKEEHKKEGKIVKYWTAWESNNKNDAEEIEKYFIGKGMDGNPGGGKDNSKYVYIF